MVIRGRFHCVQSFSLTDVNSCGIHTSLRSSSIPFETGSTANGRIPVTSDLRFTPKESERHITRVCEVKQTIFRSQTQLSQRGLCSVFVLCGINWKQPRDDVAAFPVTASHGMFSRWENMHRQNGQKELDHVLRYTQVALRKSSYLGYKLRESLFYLDHVAMLQQKHQTAVADRSEASSDDSRSHVKMVTRIWIWRVFFLTVSADFPV